MLKPRAKNIGCAIILLLLTCQLNALGVETGETERLIRRITPPMAVIKEEIEKKDQFYFDSYYEPSLIIQGNRTGRWTELTNTFGYIHENINGYFYVSQLDRLGQDDYTANWGSYITLKDAFVHMEVGFGWDVDYIYNFQSVAEYGQKLIKDVFWQVGYNYRMYSLSGDVHNFYPGLIYYFGDSYISANYGTSWIESRDFASFGTVRGVFAITTFLKLYGGVAVGERLYDIYGINPANKESGYILFIGTILNFKNVNGRVGYIYGTEQPKFQKHGVNCSLMVKF